MTRREWNVSVGFDNFARMSEIGRAKRLLRHNRYYRRNAWLVSNRKVSFQDISKADDLFKTFFEIDLSELAGETNWRTIKEALGKRNCITHNGGLDKNHVTIHVTKQYAIDVMAAIEIIVDKAENKLKSTGLLFGP